MEDDLLFGASIEARLRVLGYAPALADNTPALDRLLKASPALVLVNIGSATLDWQHLVDHAKNESQWRHVPILAYGPHSDLGLRRQALAAGCDAVVARSAVAANLPALVQKWAWEPDLSPCQDALPPALLRGIQEFNRREFFECHETIEAAWMVEPRSIRLLYQGILQVGVALYHVQRQNWRGAMKVLTRALPKLAHFEPACMGVDVSQLLADARCIRQQLLQLGEQHISEFDPELFPTIQITTLPANRKEDLSL